MPDFTHPLAIGLNVRRKVFHGGTATLMLLKFPESGIRGYEPLIEVLEDWRYSKGKQIGEPIILEIAESETVTAELLDQTEAVSIDGKIWKLEDDGKQAPTYETKRVWKFQIKPSGEPTPIPDNPLAADGGELLRTDEGYLLEQD